MKDTLTVFKWFWSDQDQAQEAWLREMAQRGFHLQDVNLLWRYTFVSGPPSDTVYRMDASAEANKADYRQLMEDSGWHLVTKSDTWCYWRQVAVQGKPLEIYSDAESKIAQYKHVIYMYAGALMGAATVINVLANSKTMSMPVKMIFAALCISALTWTLYRMLRLRRRIRPLRRD